MYEHIYLPKDLTGNLSRSNMSRSHHIWLPIRSVALDNIESAPDAADDKYLPSSLCTTISGHVDSYVLPNSKKKNEGS